MPTSSTIHSPDYLFTPNLGSGPGVLVLHSGRGLTKSMKQLCTQLTRDGYVVLAPDIFDGETPATEQELRKITSQFDQRSLHNRLEDSVEVLRQYEKISRDKIGIIGFGYGAELACGIIQKIDATCGGLVLFYGYQEVQWGAVSTPILGHFAELDRELSGSRVKDIRVVLKSHDTPHDLFIYNHTKPLFMETELLDRYEPEAAQMAWERTLRFLRERLFR